MEWLSASPAAPATAPVVNATTSEEESSELSGEQPGSPSSAAPSSPPSAAPSIIDDEVPSALSIEVETRAASAQAPSPSAAIGIDDSKTFHAHGGRVGPIEFGHLIINADFDGGNLARVSQRSDAEAAARWKEWQLSTSPPNDFRSPTSATWRHYTSQVNGEKQRSARPPPLFSLWSRADCEGTAHATRSRSWFAFSVRGANSGRTLQFEVFMSNQEKLYRHDFRPVYRSLPSQPEWQPLKQSVQFLSTPSSEGGGRAEQFSIRFAHKVESSNETLYFAFCYPHGYAETTAQLAWLDAVFRLPQAHVSPPVAPYLLRLPETWFQAIVDWLPSWLGGSGGRAVRPPHLTPEAAETATTTTSDAAARSPPRPPQAESGTGRPSFFPPWGSVSPSSRAVTTAEERLAVQRFARARLRSVAHAAALEASVSSRALGDASKTARALGTSSGSAASIAMARPLAPHQPDGEGGAFLQGARLAAEMQRVHAELAAAAVASADAHLPQSAPKGVYYRRELLSRSLEGRRIDMLTITAEGAPDEEEREEDALPAPLLPEGGKRPRRFPGRRYILVTSRVHPGETPSSHVLNGLIAFLLQVDDPPGEGATRALRLQDHPDPQPRRGVPGHYRYDTRGVNLNRKYASATFEAQPAVYASMAVARQLHEAGMLHMVLDLHAHAGKRAAFSTATSRSRRRRRSTRPSS